MERNYRFPVVKGIQARKEYYIAMISLNMLPKLFQEIDDYVDPEHRAQRKLNEARIPTITKYILDNRYIVSIRNILYNSCKSNKKVQNK